MVNQIAHTGQRTFILLIRQINRRIHHITTQHILRSAELRTIAGRCQRTTNSGGFSDLQEPVSELLIGSEALGVALGHKLIRRIAPIIENLA